MKKHLIAFYINFFACVASFGGINETLLASAESESSSETSSKERSREREREREREEEERRVRIKPHVLSADDLIDSFENIPDLLKDPSNVITHEVLVKILERRGRTGRNIVKTIAKYLWYDHPDAQDRVVQTIIDDHSRKSVDIAEGIIEGRVRIREGDTYFRTDHRSNIRKILKKVITDFDDYKFYPGKDGGRDELELRKKFEEGDIRDYVGADSIGKVYIRGGRGEETNTVIIGLGIDTISKERGNSNWSGGNINTAHLLHPDPRRQR